MTHRKIFRIAPALTLLLAGTVAGLWWFKSFPPPTAEAVSKASPPPLSKATVAPPAAPLSSADLPMFGTEAFAKMAKERGAAWMAGRNRDAVSLLALWDMTGDEAVLAEAAEKFPANPQVCLAMLNMVFGKGGATDAEKAQWIERLIAADPENPLGHYYEARIAAKKGDSTAALAALEAALVKKGRINHYLRDRMIGAKEGLLASGVGLKETYMLSSAGPLGKSSEGFYGISNAIQGIFKTAMAGLNTPGQEEERQTLAELGFRVAEQQRLTQSPSLVSDLVAQSLRTRFLQEMDPQTEIGNTGRTAAQELELALAQKETLSQLMKSSNAAQAFRQQAPIEIQGQHTDRMMMDGEAAALKYLISEMEKAKQ